MDEDKYKELIDLIDELLAKSQEARNVYFSIVDSTLNVGDFEEIGETLADVVENCRQIRTSCKLRLKGKGGNEGHYSPF